MEAQNTNTIPKLIKLPDVCDMTALGPRQIYRLIKKKTFPKPVKQGPRARAWHFHEVAAWIESLPKATFLQDVQEEQDHDECNSTKAGT